MSDAVPDPEQVAVVVQQALDAVARQADEQSDLVALLRAELARRGVEVDDEAWLAEAAGHLGSGRPVVVDDPDRQD